MQISLPQTEQANPRAIQEIEKSDAIIYGMGSLYTSICPILCLDGMGEVIASREVPKVRTVNRREGQGAFVSLYFREGQTYSFGHPLDIGHSGLNIKSCLSTHILPKQRPKIQDRDVFIPGL